jgi:NTP pyrophosphatase (non-canonical NTP hydrolase)
MMEVSEINNFIESEIKKLESHYSHKDGEKLTMAMGFKVVEETGELFNELLSHEGYQRKDKLEKFKIEDLEKEFADVIFSTLILAKRFHVDIEKAMKIKMSELKNRVLIK